MNTPDELQYTQNHEWVKIENRIATVGITEYAQSELGDIVYVEMPAIGTTIKQDETMGSIEAVKTVADLFAPVTGKIIEVNPELENSPEKINNEPYQGGWIAKIELTDASGTEPLMSAEEYRKKINA